MRHNKLIWAAAALVILAGCQKTDWTGKSIRFGAVSRPAPDTKTAYSGVFTGDVERINWTAGDKVRVYSDVATRKEGSDTYKWADYIVADPAAASDPTRSNANLSIGSGEGLQWGSGTHHFYGIYPAPATADAPAAVKGTSDTNPMEATIPASGQTLANSGFMVAYKETAEPSGSDKVELLFEPAFTAFEVVANWKDTDMAIKSVTLKSGNTALTGAFTAYYNSGTTKWVFGGFPAYSESGNGTITVTPSSPIPLTNGGEPAKFLFYALPQDLTQITLIFTVRISGASADVNRTLELKAATAITGYKGHDYAAGQWLIFNACNKSKISGVLIPGSVWDVDNNTPVVLRETAAKDWDDDQQDMNYGTDLVVNVKALDEVNLTTHSYRFSIYEPHGETWKIKVLNGSGTVVSGVKIVCDNPTPVTSGNGELTGLIRGGSATGSGLVEFHLEKADSSAPNATGGEDCTLSFSIITGLGTADEHEYSINSDVVRGNWGTGTWDYKFINF